MYTIENLPKNSILFISITTKLKPSNIIWVFYKGIWLYFIKVYSFHFLLCVPLVICMHLLAVCCTLGVSLCRLQLLFGISTHSGTFFPACQRSHVEFHREDQKNFNENIC